MRGSLLVTFFDEDGRGGDYVDIFVNDVQVQRIYTRSNNLYSHPLFIGDVVRIEFEDSSGDFVDTLSVTRRDFTTDNEDGDNGIKETSVAVGIVLTTYTFTVSTINSAYDFIYILDNELILQYQILTENYDPILTQDYKFINQN